MNQGLITLGEFRRRIAAAGGLVAGESELTTNREGRQMKTYFQECIELFDRWYSERGHWIYPSRAEAMMVWMRRGIDGLPKYPDVV